MIVDPLVALTLRVLLAVLFAAAAMSLSLVFGVVLGFLGATSIDELFREDGPLQGGELVSFGEVFERGECLGAPLPVLISSRRGEPRDSPARADHIILAVAPFQVIERF